MNWKNTAIVYLKEMCGLYILRQAQGSNIDFGETKLLKYLLQWLSGYFMEYEWILKLVK